MPYQNPPRQVCCRAEPCHACRTTPRVTERLPFLAVRRILARPDSALVCGLLTRDRVPLGGRFGASNPLAA